MAKLKTGPLSKAEKFYIEEHLGMSLEELGADLNRSEEAVGKFAKTKLPKGKKKAPAKKKPEGTTAGDLMGHHKTHGVAIMTPGASERGDESRKDSSASQRLRNHPDVYVLDPDKPVR